MINSAEFSHETFRLSFLISVKSRPILLVSRYYQNVTPITTTVRKSVYANIARERFFFKHVTGDH